MPKWDEHSQADLLVSLYTAVQKSLGRDLQDFVVAEMGKRGHDVTWDTLRLSRPNDYFAEMVKPDEHMDRVKAKLVEDATAKKAAAEARKLRDLKKFGKQVQVAKIQERAKAKKDTLEKIKDLKRKRQESSSGVGEREADLFDVAVDDELKQHNNKGGAGNKRSAGDRTRGEPNRKRVKKNEKYGFGGKKKHSKSGDAMSSGDLGGFSVGRNRAGFGAKGKPAARPGKSKRAAMASKRR